MRGRVGAIFVVIVLAICVVVGVNCMTKVEPGYTAVQYSVSGGLKDETLGQGLHFTSPTIRTTLYVTSLQQSYMTAGNDGDSKEDESFYASTSEGKSIKVELTYSYQYDADRLPEIFTRFGGQSGKEVRDSFIKPNIRSWAKEVAPNYSVSQLIGADRAAANTALTEYVAKKFETYGIIVSNVSFSDISVDSDTEQVINDKIAAQQKADTQAITNQANIDKAKADAEVAKTNAQAEADTTLIKAQAQAEANEILQDSIDYKILMKQWISKWDGTLPTYYGGGDSSLMITASSLAEADETEASK